MWNSISFILFGAMMIVIATTARILYVEHKRRHIFWGSYELITFAITGAGTVVLLWGILVVQWWRL